MWYGRSPSVSALLFVFILFEHYLPLTQQVLISLGLILTLINCGAIMEQKKWVFYLEFLRLLTVTIGIVIAYPAGWLSVLLLLVALLLIRYFETIRDHYLYWVYQRRQ